jgi:predicted phosphodiesterase
MRIIALADLHYDRDTRDRVGMIARAVCSAEADVLVIAGDCAAGGYEYLEEVLSLFEQFDGHRLMVPGNHDLWQQAPPFDTWRVYETLVPEIAESCGFHCLDSAPVVIDGTAFVGSMGWYDYAMRQTTPPPAKVLVVPIEVYRSGSGKPSFRAVPGAHEKPWDQLTAEDYAANGLIWKSAGGRPRVAVWNDALNLDWGRDAPEMAQFFADRLREQLEEVAEDSEQVVAVTHFVPFMQLVDHNFERPGRAFARAYLGSPTLGDALLEADNLKLIIYGHRHRQQVSEVEGVVAADATVNSGDGPLLLTLPE